MVDPISSASGFAVPGATGKSALGKDDFMQLMIAQLKNQDPMSPMEGAEYAAQLAQFSSLEQLMNINTSLESSVSANLQLTSSISNTMTAALIGKEAKLTGNKLSYTGSESTTEFGYKLPSDANSLTIKIYDKNGNVIKTISDAEKTSGDHKLSWDFTDDNGNKVTSGDYTFSVEAKNANGDPLEAALYRVGTISAIRFTDRGTKLVIGKTEYDISEISEILAQGK